MVLTIRYFVFSRFQGAWVLFYRDRLVRISISHCKKSRSLNKSWKLHSIHYHMFLSMHVLTGLIPSFHVKCTGQFTHIRKCHRTDKTYMLQCNWLFSAIWGVQSTCCLSNPYPLRGGVLSQGFISYYCLCFFPILTLSLSHSIYIAFLVLFKHEHVTHILQIFCRFKQLFYT